MQFLLSLLKTPSPSPSPRILLRSRSCGFIMADNTNNNAPRPVGATRPDPPPPPPPPPSLPAAITPNPVGPSDGTESPLITPDFAENMRFLAGVVGVQSPGDPLPSAVNPQSQDMSSGPAVINGVSVGMFPESEVDSSAPISSLPTDSPAQESSASDLPPQITQDMSAYPQAHLIMVDPAVAARLGSSGLLNQLRVVDYIVLRNVGTVRLTVGSVSIEITPYMQVLLKVAKKYYASLPNIGHSMITLQLMHYYLRTHTSGRLDPPPPLIMAAYQELCSSGLDDLILLAARAFIDPAAITAGDLLTVMNVSTCIHKIERIRQEFPDFYAVYNMTAHFCHGGLSCIEPILDILRSDAGLSEYVSRICQGRLMLQDGDVNLLPRPGLLPHAPYQSPVFTANPDPSSSRPSSSRNIPTRPSVVYGSYGEGTSSARTSRNQPSQDTSREGSIPPMQNPAGDGDTPTPVRQATVPPGEASDLLRQGDPSRIQVIRDTTAFREGIERYAELQAEILRMSSKQNEMQTALETAVRELGEVKSALQNMERAFSLFVSQSSISNLGDREVLNRAVLTGAPPTVTNMASNTPTRTPVNSQSLQTIRARMVAYPGSGESKEAIAADLKNTLLASGYCAFAECIVPEVIERVPAKQRILARIDAINREVRTE